MIIAGDIGGTKTNVALFKAEGARVGRPVVQQSFPSGRYDSLEAIVGEFVAAQKPDRLTHACFGVAGPVVRGRVGGHEPRLDDERRGPRPRSRPLPRTSHQRP